ncbi:alpha/beta hydrolase [Streptomyces sp. ITFR-16]|uniref:alpha/beta fold hydrolase n=1 Tax=Streptomyces sp. ITFR-16 TaxID=3075198 RepID=UPI00288B4887|nr:alpha/beta hydrolase [Streptomyces sp. ITFR-16]WNI24577.1 alpha/beta hydrolase [Streptomyces sp. ITFR-16]
MTWSERVVVRDGVRLVCRDWGGAGQPVLLLHGLAGHAGEWDVPARLLGHAAPGSGPGRRVIAVDQRGHGSAERTPEDVSRAAYVADALAVVDQLGLERPVLVGQSLGGHTALPAAAARPEGFRAAVLVEAGPGRADTGTPDGIGKWIDGWPVPFPSREAAAEFFGGGPLGEGWAAGLEERDGGWWPRFDREVMVGAISENARRSFWDEWDAVRCPVLLVLGQSGFLPPEEPVEMLRRNPAATAVSVPGTGHDLHLERPGVLHGLITGFLDGIEDG